MGRIEKIGRGANIVGNALAYIVGLVWVCSLILFPFLGTGLGLEYYGIAGAIVGCGLGLSASMANGLIISEVVKKHG